jgi:hypothetical protein
VAAALDAKAKSTLKKLLQQGRKFFLLTKAPEVAVTRLDAIRLEELALLCLGSIQEARVKVILGKMAGIRNLSKLRLIGIVWLADVGHCSLRMPSSMQGP